MSKLDDYRRFAASALELAHKTDSLADKARLFGMADAWLDLADRLKRLLARRAHRTQNPRTTTFAATSDLAAGQNPQTGKDQTAARHRAEALSHHS